MNDKRLQSNQAGSTILYVLFILLVITLLATTITTIMLRNNRITLGLSHATHAAYASESGMERALYYVQYARQAKIIGSESAAASLSGLTETFSTQANYSIIAQVNDDTYTTSIAASATEQWDIFGETYRNGYTQPPSLTALADLDNISISWNESSSCTAGNTVEIAFSTWTESEWEDITDPTTVQTRYIVQCPSTNTASTFDCNYWLGVDDTHLYKVRVKPLDCAIEAVTVAALDSTASVITTRNLVTVESTGEFTGSSRMVTTTNTIWQPRLQRYFDFVVFSEDQITK